MLEQRRPRLANLGGTEMSFAGWPSASFRIVVAILAAWTRIRAAFCSILVYSCVRERAQSRATPRRTPDPSLRRDPVCQNRAPMYRECNRRLLVYACCPTPFPQFRAFLPCASTDPKMAVTDSISIFAEGTFEEQVRLPRRVQRLD